MPENWDTYLEAGDSESGLDFQNFDTNIHFWANLVGKVKGVHFAWKLSHRVSKGSGSYSNNGFLKFQP